MGIGSMLVSRHYAKKTVRKTERLFAEAKKDADKRARKEEQARQEAAIMRGIDRQFGIRRSWDDD